MIGREKKKNVIILTLDPLFGLMPTHYMYKWNHENTILDMRNEFDFSTWNTAHRCIYGIGLVSGNSGFSSGIAPLKLKRITHTFFLYSKWK